MSEQPALVFQLGRPDQGKHASWRFAAAAQGGAAPPLLLQGLRRARGGPCGWQQGQEAQGTQQRRPLCLASLTLGGSSRPAAGSGTSLGLESPFKPGMLVNGGKYKLEKQLGDNRYTWLWLATVVDGAPAGAGAAGSGQQQAGKQQEVVIKVSKDSDLDGYADGAREREMTLQAQPITTSFLASFTSAIPKESKGQQKKEQEKQKQQQPQHPHHLPALDAAHPDASSPVVKCLGWFDHPGTSGGRHHALVLERLGDSLEEVMAKYGGSLMPRGPGGSAPGLPMPVVRKVVRRLLLALDQLHREHGIVHRALFPEHVLLRGGPFESALAVEQGEAWRNQVLNTLRRLVFLPPLPPKLKEVPAGATSELTLPKAPLALIDFGQARALDSLPGAASAAGSAKLRRSQQQDAGLGLEDLVGVGGHPSFRPPEELLALPISPGYDMWQVGCLVWWLATGNHLFSDTLELGPPSTQGGAGAGQGAAPPPPLTLEEKHLADMITSFGRIPSELIESSPVRGMYFKRSGRLKLEANYRLTRDPLARVLVRDFGFDDAEARSLQAFLEPLFKDPSEARPSARAMLWHPFLVPRRAAGAASQSGWSLDSESEDYNSEVVDEALAGVLGSSSEAAAGAPQGKGSGPGSKN